ncbi:Ger(x)C family spore germination protein [Paenibacillus gansuensis]|uniref:Ger(X)C family spore germination protein n=1 Tax=Paenibacillus gansuensis TaxID=306542 RepID=A0ABW5P970_9BACL
MQTGTGKHHSKHKEAKGLGSITIIKAVKSAMILLLPIVMITLFLPGCWNRRELNDLAITLGLGLDKEENGNYTVSAQVVNPSSIGGKSRGGGATPAVVYTAEGRTILEAVRKMTKQTPREIYSAHLRVLVIGERLAKEGVAPALDYLARDHEIRNDFYILVARRTTAQKVLRIFTPLETVPAQKMFNSLTTSEQVWAPSIGIYLDDLLSRVISKNMWPVLTGVEIAGPVSEGESLDSMQTIDPPARLTIGNLAVFKKDRLVAWLNEKESKGYNYIMDNVKNTVGHVRCPKGGVFNAEVVKADTKFKGSLEHNKPVIDVHSVIEANVAEVMCDADISDVKVMQQLEWAGRKAVLDIMESSVQKAKSCKCDVFGFGETFHRKHPQQWKRMEKEWDEMFPRVKVRYHVGYTLRRTGTLNKAIRPAESGT